MAVANTKSDLVANQDANPRKLQNLKYYDGRQRKAVATVEIQATDDDGSVFRMVPVYSGWTLDEILLMTDAITGGSDYDVGLYETAANGGTAADKDVYADGLDLSSAAKQDVAYHTRDIADVAKAVWQDLGLSEDPRKWYDLCVTGNTVGSAAGTVSMRLRYTDGT